MKGLPFNRYTWLTTHNAFARLGARSATGSIILSPQNQQDSITDQLNVKHLIFFLLHICILFTYLYFVHVNMRCHQEKKKGFGGSWECA